MRRTSAALLITLVLPAAAAELESRQLTTYVPQDLLETAVRTEGWTEFPLKVAGGVRKGDIVRVWAGGTIDRGNGDYPSQFADGPHGVSAYPSGDAARLALSPKPEHAFALLVKTEGPDVVKCLAQGKALEIKLAKDKERLWIGFNDERGRYIDNHLGRGRRHEFDPLWVRIEVVRITVD
jgi:hypothetical protein